MLTNAVPRLFACIGEMGTVLAGVDVITVSYFICRTPGTSVTVQGGDQPVTATGMVGCHELANIVDIMHMHALK